MLYCSAASTRPLAYVFCCRNPSLAAKQKKTTQQQLQERPRFSSVAKVPVALGGFKPQL